MHVLHTFVFGLILSKMIRYMRLFAVCKMPHRLVL